MESKWSVWRKMSRSSSSGSKKVFCEWCFGCMNFWMHVKKQLWLNNELPCRLTCSRPHFLLRYPIIVTIDRKVMDCPKTAEFFLEELYEVMIKARATKFFFSCSCLPGLPWQDGGPRGTGRPYQEHTHIHVHHINTYTHKPTCLTSSCSFG